MPIPSLHHLHHECLLCGQDDRLGLNLRFQSCADGLWAWVVLDHRHQGYHRIGHGGLTAALLDAVMTNCLLRRGIEALTAALQIRFRAPAPLHTPLLLRARLQRQRRRHHLLCASLHHDDHLLAEAEGRFMSTLGAPEAQDDVVADQEPCP